MNNTPNNLTKENQRYSMVTSRVIDRIGQAVKNIDGETVLNVCESIIDIIAEAVEGY